MPSIEHFRQFLVLAEYLNFSAAAESMFITQPALSRHITALENSLDIKLFERTTQSVTLTPAGEFFKERIAALLDDYDDIASRLRILKSGYSKRLRIGCPYYAINDYLGDVPEHFGGIYPDIKLQYTVGDPHEVMQCLLDDKVDLAIVARYPLPRMSLLERCDVYTEPLGVLLNKRDPLSRKPELSLTDLKSSTFFSVGNSYFTASWHHIVSLCRQVGFTPSSPALFNQMEALIMAIRNGDGITIIGRHMRNQESELITYRPLTEPSCIRQVSIWYKPDSENSAIQKFIKFYTQHPFDRG
ncbi:MAG: LysR family transcriptional regulator [Oscillospiraceae bacterium]